MTELTKQEMEAILLEHEKAELELDIDATMATLVAEPHYELAFLGLAIDGWDAVHRTYRRIIGPLGQNIAAKRRVHAVARNTLIREAAVTFNDSNGQRINGLYLVVMEFDPELKKIKGERMYTDPLFGQVMAKALGDDFADMAGVSKIADNAPVIEEHDAYAVASARGIAIARSTEPKSPLQAADATQH